MSFKDDPLQQSNPPGRTVTLWLEGEGMAEARENFLKAYLKLLGGDGRHVTFDPEKNPHMTVTTVTRTVDEVRVDWEIAWAAAIAAFSYLMEGRIAPK